MTRTSEKFSTFSALIFQLILLHLSLCTCDQSFQKAKDKCPDGQALDLNGKCIKKFVLPQRKDCPQPDIRFGGYDLEFGGRIANFWCEDGWTLASQTLGQNHATCKLGAWDRPLPSCVKSGCEELHPPVYGHLEYDLDHALARFECYNPYLLVGERVLGCDGHAWNATIPQCIELTTTTTKAPTLKQHSRNTELTSVSTTAKASTVLLIITLLHGYVNFQSDLK